MDPNKFEYLKCSDLVITHGDHTSIMEAIVYGVLSLDMVNKGHTERLSNAMLARELNVADLVEVGNDTSSKCLLENVKLVER